MAQKKDFPANKLIIAVFLFAFSYVVIWALSAARSAIDSSPLGLLQVLSLPPFESPMYYIMPAASLFLVFFLVDWANDYFETKQAMHPLFPVLFFALSLVAFFLAEFWYVSNFVKLSGQTEVVFDYWGLLKQNAFMLFMWGGVFGWATRFAVEKIKL